MILSGRSQYIKKYMNNKKLKLRHIVIESTYKDFFISIDVTFEQKILLEPEFSHNSLLILTIS